MRNFFLSVSVARLAGERMFSFLPYRARSRLAEQRQASMAPRRRARSLGFIGGSMLAKHWDNAMRHRFQESGVAPRLCLFRIFLIVNQGSH